jgi:hypothetical protein
VAKLGEPMHQVPKDCLYSTLIMFLFTIGFGQTKIFHDSCWLGHTWRTIAPNDFKLRSELVLPSLPTPICACLVHLILQHSLDGDNEPIKSKGNYGEAIDSEPPKPPLQLVHTNPYLPNRKGPVDPILKPWHKQAGVHPQETPTYITTQHVLDDCFNDGSYVSFFALVGMMFNISVSALTTRSTR